MEEEWQKIKLILMLIEFAHLIIIYLIWVMLRILEQKIY